MKKLWFFLTFFPLLALAAVPGRFMQYPDINGDKIVFTYEEDLWVVNRQGGLATRLTTHPGNEFCGKFSPDGKQIAFSGNYDGSGNVYVMPGDGGVPRRLTWQPGDSRVVTWMPDGKKVVYRSGVENTFRPIVKLFAVPVDGSMPEKLPVPRGVLASFSPDGRKMVYAPRGNEEYYWKRYKGGQYQDIWLYDFSAASFTKVTDYVGKNSYPMWVEERMYFVSDRGEDGIANIYAYDFKTRQTSQVTRHADYDVQMASSDGRQIVYMNSGYLYVLDCKTNSSRKVDVSIPTDRWKMADRTVNPKEYIQTMALDQSGKIAVFEARGDVFLVPTDDQKPVTNMTQTTASRERYPQLSPDGKWLAFFSDKSGEYELYLQKADQAGSEWVRLTNGLNKTVYRLEWSPDSKKILFGDKTFTLYYVDVETKKLVTIGSSNRLKNDEFTWEATDYTWAPDSRWVAYTFILENRNSQVYLYNLEQAKSHPLTSDFYDNLNPAFDANGEYLYYLSYRNFDVQMDVFEDNHIISAPVKVMVVQLKSGQKPPFEKADKEEKKETTPAPFRIDLEGLADRTWPLPVQPGNLFYCKAGKGKVSWASVDAFTEDEYEELYKPNGAEKWQWHIYDMESQKESKTDLKISDWRISGNGEQVIIKKSNDYFVTSLDKAFSSKALGDKVNLERMTYRVNLVDEWNQIFSDTWRWYRDFFYDVNMHGRNWKKMGDDYRTYIPQLTSRQDLNWLLSQLVGELCVSHTYVGGGDMGPQCRPDNPVFTGALGVDFAQDGSGYYRFAKIYGPTDFNRDVKNPLVRPDLALREGDYLIAIDDREIKYPDNPYKYLQVTKGQKVKITVNSKPQAAGAKSAEIEPIRSEYELRYNRWVADNIARVLAAGNGDIGYMHMTAMGAHNLGQLDKFWRAFRYKKGLVIDVRGNGGGWVEYFVIDKLERQQVAYNTMQGMESFRYPNSASRAHYALVTNEYNGSDGEAFVEHFKARKLGTVIGVPSWGGLVGIINGQKTIDNGTVHQSNNAFYGREGKWLVENHGADPDIYLENDPASEMAGRDLQLERALEVLKKQIQEKPWTFPAKPAIPKR